MLLTPCPPELVLPPMADVVEIDNLDDLQHYRMAWNALLEKTPRRSFFMTFDWLELAWQHFSHVIDYRVLVIRSGGKPIGFVPLCVVKEQYKVGQVRTLTYPLADWGAWYGPIGPDQAACHWLAAGYLAKRERDWDLVDFRWLDKTQAKTKLLATAMQTADMPAELRPYHESSIIEINGTWENYLQTRSKKRRHEIRRQLRSQECASDIEFIRHRPHSSAQGDGDPRWDLFEDCLTVAAESWQGGSTNGNTLSHDQVSAFLRDCHAVAARLGMLDMTLLRIAGKSVAYGYNYHYRGEVFGLRMGYDPGYRGEGVGTILLVSALKDSFKRHDSRFDLGVNNYNYKHRYRTHVEQSYRLTHYPATGIKSQGLRLTNWLKRHVASL